MEFSGGEYEGLGRLLIGISNCHKKDLQTCGKIPTNK